MNKRINKLIIKRLTFALIMLAICIWGFHMTKPYLPHKYGTTTGNFMNEQRLVALDGEVYFFGSNDNGKGLFKIDREGKAVYISVQNGLLLNGVGDYLYFRTRNTAGGKDQIVKMKKDGSESRILIEGDIGLELSVVDNTIYFSYAPQNESSKKIYSMSTDGNFLREANVSTGIRFQLLFNPQIRIKKFGALKYVDGLLQMKDKYIYFALIPDADEPENYDLFRTKGADEENEFLADGVTAFNAAEDGWLYYAQSNKEVGSVVISKMNMATEEHEQLAEIATDGEKVLSINVAADKVYIGFERQKPYLLNTDGTNLIRVYDFLNK